MGRSCALAATGCLACVEAQRLDCVASLVAVEALAEPR